MVMIPCFHCRKYRFHLGEVTKIPYAALCGPKKISGKKNTKECATGMGKGRGC